MGEGILSSLLGVCCIQNVERVRSFPRTGGGILFSCSLRARSRICPYQHFPRLASNRDRLSVDPDMGISRLARHLSGSFRGECVTDSSFVAGGGGDRAWKFLGSPHRALSRSASPAVFLSV